MTVEKTTLSGDTVRQVLGYLGDTNLGEQPRAVVDRILKLAEVADPATLDKVATEWGELAYAWFVARRTPWGIDWLRGLAKAELDGAEAGLDFTAVAS
ncbi:hypothetical protein [Microbacterium sp. KR10-403]|uniref:hypothetical protein n=1 Tax=Microbacterium sp. KR10-403 TaxID=3158581 RepID=UPI0032E4905F